MNDVRIFSSDKILKHLDRVCPWLEGENVFPVTVEIDLTNRCNSQCPGCAGGRSRAAGADLKDPFKIIDQLVEIKAKAITLTGGGEPLLHPQALEVVKYAKKKGLDVGFITNGIAVTAEAAAVILDNCVWVRVSLDAANPADYQITHGQGEPVFEKVVAAIALFAKTKKEKRSKCTVGVGYLTNKKLLNGMVGATKLCRELGADYIQFRPFHGDMTTIDKELKQCKKFETKDFLVLYSKHKYESMKDTSLGRNYKICYGHQFATVICANGDMTLCCHTRGDERFTLGNIYKNSIKEIWNSEQRKRAAAAINLKECVPFCRCDTFNQVLWNLKQPTEHVNFL